LTKPLRYLKLTVTYDGSAFFGFQFQLNVPTVQAELERVVALITGEKVRVIGAGRTDTGVHAIEQVVLIRILCPIPLEKLINGMNSALPGSIRISRAEETDESFHPRFSATGKHYRYLFHQVTERSPFLERFYWQLEDNPDVELMNVAAAKFIGEHDFFSFAKSPQRYQSTVRRILEAKVSKSQAVIQFDVTGTGFMHNMVRNLAKALYLVGSRHMALECIEELYRNQNRNMLGAPAPPNGLYLMKVMY
jgi:tRNA pseudouridine38-40 synthase